jgi:hypothetical protein
MPSKRKKTQKKTQTPNKQPKQEEQKIIETGEGDYEKCARMYIDNVHKNLGFITFEGQGNDKPLASSKLYNIQNNVLYENLNEFNKLQQKKLNEKDLKVNNDFISNIFECIFSSDGTQLNTDVIKVGAIVRIWSTGSQYWNNEGHSTATIDYQGRRVSFGTSLNKNITVLLDDKKVGYAHIINSPEEELVKKILYNATTSTVNNLKLVAMGYLTEQHIENLTELLIKNTDNFSINSLGAGDVYIQSSTNDKLFYPVLSSQKYSTNLFYNEKTLFGVIEKKKLKIINNKKTKKSKVDMQSVNCAEFMKLIFFDIVDVNSSHNFFVYTQLITATTPASLMPTEAYKCVADNNYTLSEPDVLTFKVGRGYLNNIYGMPKILSFIVYTTLYFGTSALVLPLLYTSTMDSWTDFISRTTIFSTALALITSIKIYSRPVSQKFSFGEVEKVVYTKEELINLFGQKETDMFIDMAKKNLKHTSEDTSTEDTSTENIFNKFSTFGFKRSSKKLGDCVSIVESDNYWHQQLYDLQVPSDFPIRKDIQIVSTRLRTNSFYIIGTYPKIRIIYYDNQDWTNELRKYMDRSKQKSKRHSSKKQSRRRSSKKQSRKRSSKKQSKRHSSKKQSRRRSSKKQSRKRSSKKQSKKRSSKKQSKKRSSKKQSKKRSSKKQSRKRSSKKQSRRHQLQELKTPITISAKMSK